METVACALCGSRNQQLLAKKSRFGIPAPMVICRDCGLVFINPRMTGEEYGKFYSSNAYRRLYSKKEAPDTILDASSIRGAEEKLRFIKNRVNLAKIMPKKFIDVGCSAGYLAYLFKKAGWDSIGIEPSIKFSDYGSRKFGIKILPILLEDMKTVKKYGFIALIHVFEHFTEPEIALKKLRSLLADGGVMYLEVPNVWEFYGRFEGDVQHPYFYSPPTLRTLLERNGFSVIWIDAGTAVRIFAKKGRFLNKKCSTYEETVRRIDKINRDYYLRGYWLFTPAFAYTKNFLGFATVKLFGEEGSSRIINALKRIARAYIRAGLPLSRALKGLGAVDD